MTLILSRGTSLAYPAGRAPGFDPTHVAAGGISQGHGFSSVPVNGGIVNLLLGKPATATGSPTAIVLSSIGPIISYPASAVYNFSGNAAVLDNNATLAGIISLTTAASSSICSSSSSLGWNLGTNGAANLTLSGSGVGSFPSSIVLSINIPYFVVASVHKALGVINYAVLRLDNGTLKTQALSTAPNCGTSNGTYQVGNITGASAIATRVACAMFAPSYMSMSAVQAWAADPWSFWFPHYRMPSVNLELVGTAAAAAFQAAWALNRNFVNQGVAT